MLKFGRYDYAALGTFFCYSGCSFAIPVVMVELARDLGFPLAEGGLGAGGLLHVARSGTMLAAMLGCGFVSGRLGKRRTLGLAVLTMGTDTTCRGSVYRPAMTPVDTSTPLVTTFSR